MGEGNEQTNDQDTSLGYAARITHRAFSKTLQKRLAKHGVPIGQWNFLRVLWRKDGLTQKALSDELGIMGPTAVVALRAMEKNGLVKRIRNKDDRRKVNIFLTDKARSLEEVLMPYIDEINALASAGITEADIEAYHRVSQIFRNNLQADD
ncbi:MarR family winged helix-turn-helix transcriptional regulator [Aestuariispira insulae]|uniref:MarR family transcriptional regulator n=1 Tax=Aestuariispira insulae TaxID=1461337 RepID=A0A3D9HKH1_9PROT|nr:MarR family transcriptional regulator [Aestuariispira insulae]RED49974.1 MarR family transcriptional regulator [Aestuariispira insulae]